MLLHQLVRANRGGVGSVRLPFSWRERAASASPPLALPAPSHIRLVALDGALEAVSECADAGWSLCMGPYERVRGYQIVGTIGSPTSKEKAPS